MIPISQLTRDELEASWEQISADYQRECRNNVDLKRTVDFLTAELDRLESLVVAFKKQIHQLNK